MKILLIKDVNSLGWKYDIVDVYYGYAKNFLLKKKLAILLTDSVKNKYDKILYNNINIEKQILNKPNEKY